MGNLTPWVKLVRFEEYGPLFVFCGLVGAVYAGVGSAADLAGLTAFIACFSASAFVLNDIADRHEDASAPASRNPLATGELGLGSGTALFALLAAGSVASLYFVPAPARYAAPLVYGLYWGYSWGPGFKSRPGLDVVVHGSVPALFVLMGYALYAPLSAGAAVVSGAVFCFAAMSGVLQGVRDLEKDSASRRSTPLALGSGRSVDLAVGLMGSGALLYGCAVLTGYLPPIMAALVPFSSALILPLLRLRSGRTGPEETIRVVRSRGMALAAGALCLYLLWAANLIPLV